MTYSAIYEAKTPDNIRRVTIQRRSLNSLFNAVRLQVLLDAEALDIKDISIFISETPANG